MKQIEVRIMGQNYMLSCPENSELRLREAVSRVDVAMCSIRDAGKVKTRDRIAVLAALNLTFELLESIAPATRTTSEEAQSSQKTAASVPESLESSHMPNAQLTALLLRLDNALGADSQPD